VAHREKKGIVLAESSKVIPETKKRAKERRTETETRKLHYVMKLTCFIERYVCHTKTVSNALLFANYPCTILFSSR